MRDLLIWLWRYRSRVVIGIGLLLIVDALQLAVPALIARGVDRLSHHQGDEIPWLAAGIILVAGGMVAARLGWRQYLIGTARMARRDLRSAVFDRLLSLDRRFYAKHPTGDLLSLSGNDLDAVFMAWGFGTMAAFDALFLILFAAGALVVIDPWLALAALTPFIPVAAVVLALGPFIHRRFLAVQDNLGVVTERVRETLTGVRVIRAHAAEPGFERSIAEASSEQVRLTRRLVRVNAAMDPLIALLGGASSAVALWWGGTAVIDGRMSLGELVGFLGYLAMLIWPMLAIGWLVGLLQRGSASMARIQQVLRAEPEIRDGTRELVGSADVRFSGLTFTWPGAAQPALSDIDLHLPVGGLVGVVGATGSGKSTLGTLLVRGEDPPPGSVLIGGIDVRDLRLDSLRRAVAVVPQEPFLFALSAHDNIALGRPDATRAEVEAVARTACVHEELAALPRGYDTVVGEKGVTLSGGQKQRIAIARALLKAAPILVLDDCLSAVDSTTEQRILGNLRGERGRRTTLVIAHRLSAVREADHLIVLDHGRISERGTHAVLLAAGGRYAQLAELQRLTEETES